MQKIILASQSPRRQEFMRLMGLEHRIVLKDVDESYPEGLQPAEIAVYIAQKKAKAFDEEITDEVVITADTIVSLDGEILGKPKDAADAFSMLRKLSGRKHEVFTGVCLLKTHQLHSFFDMTEVYFKPLSDEQINYYIEHHKPFDKAGAYGIQDWLGLIAVEKINGSYTNVAGLPTEKLYTALMAL